VRVLYIGHYLPGCTTRMRGEYLKIILNPEEFQVVNIDIPIDQTSTIMRSFGWRYKIGPLIRKINEYLRHCIRNHNRYDLVWVDKGVFIYPDFIRQMRDNGSVLVHFTPDTAFTYNKSSMFYDALPYYSYCITTKSFELGDYVNRGVRNLLFCTQGFDPALHKPYVDFSEKQGVVFIGQYEAWREETISKLLEKKILVKLSGAGWSRFAQKNRHQPNLRYLGNGLFGEDYARLISGSLLGLGLLSKKFPEKHTTRTFEIPACGTALATEYNDEIAQFYDKDDVLYFNDLHQLLEKVAFGLANRDWLEQITIRGKRRVAEGGYDYPNILKHLVGQMALNK
jgi:spore maturation protein CgeB